MQGGVTYEGNTLLTGGINVNTTGNIQALNVQITENGERTIRPPEGVDGYAPITIDTNVPIPEPVLDTLNVTSNGTYTPPSGVDGYDEVNVSVPGPVLDHISITSNGTYTPPTGTDGYDEITVNVSQTAVIQPLTRTITTNGTTVINASDLNVDGFDPVTITTAVDGYTIKTLANTPTPIASFTDGTDNPLKSLTASIVPVQSGSGDPSPTNVRPISGWSGVEIFDDPVYGGIIEWNQLMPISSYTTKTSYDVLITNNRDGSFSLNGTASGNIYADIYTNFQNSLTANHVYMFVANSTADTVRITNSYGGLNIVTSNKKIVKYTSGNVYVALFVTVGTVVDNVSVYPQCLDLTAIFGETKAEEILAMEQAEEGSGVAYVSALFPETYYAYDTGTKTCVSAVNGDTYRHYTIPFTDGQGQSVTVYGGAIDVINGVVTPCPYYASYNGEQLTGEWISDRDVYSPNTNPTIGAQVVNIGATGTPFSVQPTSIKSLDGENNVFASTGDVEELKYFADL